MNTSQIKDTAEKLVAYYEGLVANPTNGNDFSIALDTAKWWLRLLNQETPNLDEVNALVNRLNHHNEGSAWEEMKLFAQSWQLRLPKK